MLVRDGRIGMIQIISSEVLNKVILGKNIYRHCIFLKM